MVEVHFKAPMHHVFRVAARCSIFVLGAAVSSLPSLAQPVYKCGNTYSQTPCAADAQTKQLYPGAAPEKPAGLTGYELCAAAAPMVAGSPEPESARVQPVGSRVAGVILYAGQPTAAHRYDLSVDAKTAYGVYSGPFVYSCWVSEDQARVLQFSRGRSPR